MKEVQKPFYNGKGTLDETGEINYDTVKKEKRYRE